MNEKDLSAKCVRLVMEEVKLDCLMAKDREKNDKEAYSVLFGFSKYLESFEDLINKDDFGVFADDIFAMLKNYLTGKKDYRSAMSEMIQYEKTFLAKFEKQFDRNKD